MKVKKRLIVPILAVVAASTIAVGAATVSAQTADESGYPSIVSKIAERFSLNQDEVQSVFDEERAERHADMQQKFEDRLTEAVSNGDLTEEQKQAILQKHEELQADREANFENFKDMTPEERRAAMQSRHTELETWANENGIDMQYLMPFGGEGRGPRGKGMGHGMMDNAQSASETATQT